MKLNKLCKSGVILTLVISSCLFILYTHKTFYEITNLMISYINYKNQSNIKQILKSAFLIFYILSMLIFMLFMIIYSAYALNEKPINIVALAILSIIFICIVGGVLILCGKPNKKIEDSNVEQNKDNLKINY
ncbi:hypothetical protein [Spiroplasma turonicum]|uniref:Transmembrane protein n=1 Tax=Spiroplasma turonicum TaxID=216946 RepID=A0A0K1P609_9MOLU|nr:hypothetical protein [Spiroplasma turonicum]AKU79700.1 hypothetical protein STURON_00454 [Spiroplasma turonicum]ALX70718.1 hypothetical protein STURO_v1c04520 [Spiroplasma turonicum]